MGHTATRTAEVVVVGAGIVGLSTAYALAERGADYRLFEAARPGSGQSAGRTRIFRHAHRRADLVAHADSGVIWEEWQRRLGVQLLGRQGLVVTGTHAFDVLSLLEAEVARTPARRGGAARLLPVMRPAMVRFSTSLPGPPTFGPRSRPWRPRWRTG